MISILIYLCFMMQKYHYYPILPNDFETIWQLLTFASALFSKTLDNWQEFVEGYIRTYGRFRRQLLDRKFHIPLSI